jgi:hypothetical protein
MVCYALYTMNKRFSLVKLSKCNQIIDKPERAEQKCSLFTGETVIANIPVEKTVMAQFTPGYFYC